MTLSPSLASTARTLEANADPSATPIHLLGPGDYAGWREAQPAATRHWLDHQDFKGTSGSACSIPEADGTITVVAGFDADQALWAGASIAERLPPGRYTLRAWPEADAGAQLALGWALAQYQYNTYRPARESERSPRILCTGDAGLSEQVLNRVRGVVIARDLINTPPDAMMPAQLAAAMAALAEHFDATWGEIVGEDLLSQNYPAIHAVGRASAHAPRLLDLRWGDPGAPKVTLVGKGVCFDSGGLDIKSATGMRLMKKDMGGAAHALGLGAMVMGAALPVRLRILIPAVENAISGASYHPSDIVSTRAGINIEIENTDAEGRVILSDALAEGGSESPAVMLDFATLTGAARVALGTDLPAMFCNSDEVANGVLAAGSEVTDPVWRMPLHTPYRELIESQIGDIMNGTPGPFGGAITAALFLEHFVPEGVAWAHFDIMGWNTRSRAGRPEGGEAMALRAVFSYLERTYGAGTG